MSKTVFKFKQFHIHQEKSAMKVGTDGVLLGAWASHQNPIKILDIGAGTGLVSLMLAQRFPISQITGIEIDYDAFLECQLNFIESPFNNRCQVVHSSLQNFITDLKFDLIVSNPPFFKHTHIQESARNTARQSIDLTFDELISYSANFLSKVGKLCIIIPFESENQLINLARKSNLHPGIITRIKGNSNSEFKRSLISFSKLNQEVEIDELTIEISRNIYTEDYIQLTKPFYLKM